jgi:phosphatidylinositol glycan class W
LGTPLQAYTLNDKRPNILAQNKEGLVSFIGYLAIYLLGADTGLYTLPPDPYFAYRPLKKASSLKPKLGKLMNVLFSYAIVWWALFGIVHMYFPESFAVSRRLVS